MLHIMLTTFVFFLPQLMMQFFSKFFVALFLRPSPSEQRVRNAALSTAGCSMLASFAYFVISIFQTSAYCFGWLNTSLIFFFMCAVVEILLLAPLKKAGLKTAILYLTIDCAIAATSALVTSSIDLD